MKFTNPDKCYFNKGGNIIQINSLFYLERAQ